jgi:hypothetical protein
MLPGFHDTVDILSQASNNQPMCAHKLSITSAHGKISTIPDETSH